MLGDIMMMMMMRMGTKIKRETRKKYNVFTTPLFFFFLFHLNIRIYYFAFFSIIRRYINASERLKIVKKKQKIR
jgi:hypothetical protein